jgi:dTMP kinase
MGNAIEKAKSGHSLSTNTFTMLYAADFADRLEHEIIPALRAGFIVLADRYIYTAIARAAVRGADRSWVRKVFGFAMVPDAIFYMRINVEDLIPRVINSEKMHQRYWEDGSGEGIDFWESGMDLRLGEDFYDSFVEYQRRVLKEFDRMTTEYRFRVVDAGKSLEDVNRVLRQGILTVLDEDETDDKPRRN